MKGIVFFDCDSTLSGIEGVDELGRMRGEAICREIERLTNEAMGGHVPIGEIFGRRLELIRPTLEECERVGQMYIREVEATAQATVEGLRRRGWEVVIVSGGFVPCILPLARALGIGRVEAVPLEFGDGGEYVGYGEGHPATRNGGKLEIVRGVLGEMGAGKSVMVGDGMSDFEAAAGVDLFLAFTGFVRREPVVRAAGQGGEIRRLEEVLELLP